MEGDRRVAGLWCHQVLGMLSEYADDELAPETRTQVEAHLEGCDVCERFSREFADAVQAIRSALSKPPPLDPDLKERLRAEILDAD
jgi:anti-sigma factor RsiW